LGGTPPTLPAAAALPLPLELAEPLPALEPGCAVPAEPPPAPLEADAVPELAEPDGDDVDGPGAALDDPDALGVLVLGVPVLGEFP